MAEFLIEARQIIKRFGRHNNAAARRTRISAVNGVSFGIHEGSSVGLIGESGSGKSTLGRMMCGLEQPTEGTAFYRGQDISALSLKEMRPYRRHMQMIFQNSAGVFDPAYTVGESIAEMIRNNEKASAAVCGKQVEAILNEVGLSADYAGRYGRELSGGQRQRANIARALVLHPEFVVCDEPVSSLDYSLRKQILDLLNRLREAFGLTYLFITHDLHCVSHVCDHMAIMYAGKILETLDLTRYSMECAVHSYTKLLMSSSPVRSPSQRRPKTLEEQPIFAVIPDARQCCRFHTRCPYATKRCRDETPELREIETGHLVACHRFA